MSSYDAWKTTEPSDPYLDELERAEREAEEDRDAHPERYMTLCADCGTDVDGLTSHECAQQRAANRKAAKRRASK